MNAMASQGSIRSYKITIINSMTNQTQAFYLPLTIASPFVNRVFQEISYPQTMQLKEPWYPKKWLRPLFLKKILQISVKQKPLVGDKKVKGL